MRLLVLVEVLLPGLMKNLREWMFEDVEDSHFLCTGFSCIAFLLIENLWVFSEVSISFQIMPANMLDGSCL